ncbi:NAD(P)-binding protein [Aspergillus tamarii]|uniref:NAD(P)-binding protein n=1 Tax=Aspergillus tamarii TaxID=41984 RepID=A0A5N6V3Z5_ASPTM|nr:NAD(P)-binding protein [Aspergillus tamarii]
MSTTNYSIPSDLWVLVTGANGFIATHVIEAFLAQGYKVRGTVRSEKPWVDEYFKGKYGPANFETVIVPKLEEDGALDGCLADVGGVVHVACNMSWSADPQSLIPEVVTATLNVLSAAARVRSIKRVVLTSSVVTARSRCPGTGEITDYIVNENKWNDAAGAAAWDPTTPDHIKPGVVYTAAKVEAEREAWKWIAKHNPPFVLNTVLPNVNFGKILFPGKQGTSMAVTRLLLDGNDVATKIMPAQWYVDVEDTARLHVIGLLDPDVQSERLFACAGPYTWTQVLNIMRKLRPDCSAIPDVQEEENIRHFEVVPSKRAEKLIQAFYHRPGWTSLEESLARGVSD